MICPHCKGELRKGTAPFHVDRAGYHLQWDSIPAWICSQCGEAAFDSKEVEAPQEALTALETPARRLTAAH